MERKSFFKLLAGGIAGLFVAPKLWMDGLFQMAKSKTCPGCGSRIVPYRVSRIRYVGLLSEHEIQPICFCVSRCLGCRHQYYLLRIDENKLRGLSFGNPIETEIQDLPTYMPDGSAAPRKGRIITEEAQLLRI